MCLSSSFANNCNFVFSTCCMRVADSCMAGVFCVCYLTWISTDGGYGAPGAEGRC